MSTPPSNQVQKKKKVRFFYDIVCPYAYLASTQIERLQHQSQVEFEWIPMLLGGVFRAIDAPQVPAAHMSVSKAKMNGLELDRWARLWNVPFSFSKYHPQRSVEAMRLLCAIPPKKRPEVSARIFALYWVENQKLTSECLHQVCLDFQIDPQCFKSPQAKEDLYTFTQEAVDLGIFGAPAFEIDGEIYWGQDRLDQVLQALGQPFNPWPSTPPSPSPSTELIFFHDFASPFSYLASTQIEKIAHFFQVKLTYHPLLLGALFKDIGTPNVPLFAMNAPKRAYMGVDLKRWAKDWGVDFTFPNSFPLRTPTPLRVALIEPKTTPLLYKAAWVDGKDIGDPQNLIEILDQAGWPGHDLVTRTQDPLIKDQLKANTQYAQDSEIFGVPSIMIRRPNQPDQIFWGQDRLPLVIHALTLTTPL